MRQTFDLFFAYAFKKILIFETRELKLYDILIHHLSYHIIPEKGVKFKPKAKI
jgi:hypothetical protein